MSKLRGGPLGALLGSGGLAVLWFVFTSHGFVSAVIMLALGAVGGCLWVAWLVSPSAPSGPGGRS